MAVRVAINGFGRIGRLAFRQMFGAEGYEVVAINDLTSPKMLAHLLKYDSSQGKYEHADEVSSTDDSIIVCGKEIKIYAFPDANNCPWGDLKVDVVLECSGFYTSKEKAQAHISIFIKYKADVQDDGSAAVCFSCAYIFYLVITGFNRACKGKLKVAGTGTGEGIFIFIFQTNADLSFRWIGLAPVISFVIGNFHGVDVEIFCVVTGRSYFYFAAAASGTDVRVNGQIDLSHFCFACSKGAGCHAGRNKKGGKKNGSYFF